MIYNKLFELITPVLIGLLLAYSFFGSAGWL